MAAAGLRGILHTFRHPNFAKYVAGNAVSLIGTWMHRIAVGWLAWELTASPAWLGIIAMTELFPAVFLGPLGGALADRFDRVKIMIMAQSCAMATAVAYFGLAISGQLTIWLLAFLTLIMGVVIGIGHPSRLALAPSLVPSESLTTAIAINSMVFNSARFVGPALAGALITYWRIEFAFAVNAATYLALLWALASLRIPPAAEGKGPKAGRSIRSDIAEGVRFAVKHPAIGPMLLMLLVSALCIRPLVELLPGLADIVYGRGADGFATLVASIGVGAVLGGFWMAQRGGVAQMPLHALYGSVGAIAANLGMIATGWFPIAVISAVAGGIGMVMTGIGTQTTLQFSVGGHMRGRVLSLYGTVFIGGPALGALIIGAVAEVTGLRWPLAMAAVAALAAWAWVWARRDAISGALRGPDAGGDF